MIHYGQTGHLLRWSLSLFLRRCYELRLLLSLLRRSRCCLHIGLRRLRRRVRVALVQTEVGYRLRRLELDLLLCGRLLLLLRSLHRVGHRHRELRLLLRLLTGGRLLCVRIEDADSCSSRLEHGLLLRLLLHIVLLLNLVLLLLWDEVLDGSLLLLGVRLLRQRRTGHIGPCCLEVCVAVEVVEAEVGLLSLNLRLLLLLELLLLVLMLLVLEVIQV